jgi:decaprenyl-phosphate phosphoribosyltransferase
MHLPVYHSIFGGECMPKKSRLSLYLSSLRLDRWPRSLAILPGLVVAYFLFPETARPVIDVATAAKGLLAFFLAWALSTINYIVNEITDAPYDAHHPTKMHRPLVTREIKRWVLVGIGLGIGVVSIVTACLVFEWRFIIALLLLLAQGTLYNIKPFRLKDVPFVDSTLESTNNPIRFLVGWFVLSNLFPPVSLLVSWWAFGNFLMVGKRVAEKKFLTDEQAAAYRVSLRKYSLKGLIAFMIGNAVVFLATFVWFALEYHRYILLYILPGILIYLVIFIYISIRNRDAAEEPERLLRNPYFALYTLVLIILIIVAFLPW